MITNVVRHTVLHALILLTISGSFVLAGSKGFKGNWRSTFGLIQLDQKGSTIQGKYNDADGSGYLKGHISRDGRLLIGRWNEGDISGKFIFQMQSGKNSFVGRWQKNGVARSGKWMAVREAENVESQQKEPEAFTGSWETNFGRMSLRFDGKVLSGEYKGRLNRGRLQGSLNPKTGKFVANWRDNKYRGTVEFSMLKGNQAIAGEWRYSDNEYGGKWYGIRKTEIGGAISGDCENGRGTYLFADGSRYEGRWKENMSHGAGRLYDENGKLIKSGIWSEGVYMGKLESGDIDSGKAKIKLASGVIYDGQFKDGKISGKGTLSYVNGDRYEGEVSNGLAHGKGVLTWKKTQNAFSGSFRNNAMHGRGVFTFKNGNVYEGQFLNGKRHGKGRFTWTTGDSYDGQWKKDQPNGRGIYTYTNGDVYRGYLINGLKADKGTYTFKDGKKIEADWQNDRLNYLISDKAKGTHFSRPDDIVVKYNKLISDTDDQATPDDDLYLAYTINRQTVRSNGKGSRRQEVAVSYLVVSVPKEMERDQIEDYIRQLGVVLNSDSRLERVPNPVAKIQNVVNRYRFDLSETRLKTIDNGWHAYSDNLRASSK
ncbi:MAG: MORN repeat-containing protein [Calditrichia bacterium]